MSKWYGRCPDGEVTDDASKYGTSWMALAKEAERAFPGYICGGYDPDIMLRTSDYSDYITLSIKAVQALIKGRNDSQ